jgi:hypothetical protein
VYCLGMTATTKTIAKRDLPKATTADLIAQYNLAISSTRGRYSNYAPRQKRICHIVDLLAARGDDGDAEVLAWEAVK